MVIMVGYFDFDVVLLSVFQSETDKLVKYDVIRKCPTVSDTYERRVN